MAVCDCELMNTTLSTSEVDVPITAAFYGNCRASENEVREALQKAENANLMGERAVAIAVELGLVSPDGCVMIGNIPHAQIFRL